MIKTVENVLNLGKYCSDLQSHVVYRLMKLVYHFRNLMRKSWMRYKISLPGIEALSGALGNWRKKKLDFCPALPVKWHAVVCCREPVVSLSGRSVNLTLLTYSQVERLSVHPNRSLILEALILYLKYLQTGL